MTGKPALRYGRLLLVALAIFVFALIWNGIVHLVILREAHQAIAAFTRPPSDRALALSLLLAAGVALLFSACYALCARSRVRDGLLLGLLFALLAGLLVDLNQYILYPVPAGLALQWFGFGTLEFLAYGLIAAWLYPPAPGRGV